MRIQHNIPGMRTLRYGKKLNNDTAKALEKLSSGYCINRAGDDAAGLAVSERIRMSLTEFGRCKNNIQEGINLANTADAALQEVNDMLNRAQELCVAAANGTYSEQEKAELQKELDALYSEVDRIFESSRFNEVELFRHEDYDYSNGRFEYLEKIIETSADDLQEWGVLEGIDQEFGLAEPARAATVTLTLDSDIHSAADLAGKNFTIQSPNSSVHTVSFVSGGGSSYGRNITIDVDGHSSVQSVFDTLCSATTSPSSWKNDNLVLDCAIVDGNTVTLSFQKTDLMQTVYADGKNNTSIIPEGTGTLSNNISVYSTQLNPVDNGENTFICGPAKLELKLLHGKLEDAQLLASDITNLTGNTLRVRINGSNYQYYDISFINDPSVTATGTTVNLADCPNIGTLREAIADAISSCSSDVTASYDNNGTIHVILSSLSSDASAYIDEGVLTADSTTITTNALSGINVSVSQPGSGESCEVTAITLPSSFDHETPFSILINDTIYHFYDSSCSSLSGYSISSSYRRVDIKNMDPEQIQQAIFSCVSSEYSSSAIVSRSGNTITLTANTVNTNLGVIAEGIDSSFSATGTSTDYVLLGSGTNQYFTQEYEVSFDLASSVATTGNLSALVGSGFQLNGTWYQFTNDDTGVNISGCTSYQDIASTLAQKLPSGFSVSSADSGNLTISGSRTTSSSNLLTLSDGYDGLFNNAPGTVTAKSSGGTEVGHPSATIDFSKYNKDNFRELYGKGFRVTCATCKGEYVNVIFCYDKAQADFPESFDKTDEETGQLRTIHNLAVELKGMNDGSDIVQAIVNQLRPELDHYTDVAVGNPSSVLNVLDKRRGDIYVDDNHDSISDDNELRQAQILSGVYTNCIYTVEEQFVPAPDAVLGDIEIDYRFVKIYTNSESDNEYIDIHLPYLTLENLKLNPPEPDLSTTESATETLEHARAANNAISFVRGTLGADCNRLEHAYADLAQAEEQAADAFSRIRDTDMAELMMEQTKLSILMQAQQAAQTHTMQQPQSVLKLMQ